MRHILAYLCAFMLVTFEQRTCQAKKFATNLERADGFGAQFQTIIYSVIYAEFHNMEYLYNPFKSIEHNYNNDPNFIEKKEWLINFINNFEIYKEDAAKLEWATVIHFFEQNLDKCVTSYALKKIKNIFRLNKNVNNYFNKEYLNIVIHIRRPNPNDNRIDGTNTDDTLFLNIIDKLRITYASANPLFHIQSQGNPEKFSAFKSSDIILHLNESVEDAFTSMVLADVLVTSRSSFSYTAAILSEGTVYYIPFWHPPLPGWIVVDAF